MKKLTKRNILVIIIISLITYYTFKADVIYSFYRRRFEREEMKRLKEIERREKRLNERFRLIKRREREFRIQEKATPPCPSERCMNRHYNKCLKQEIPLVSTQLETAQYLYFTNSSLIRFGDSEITLIWGIDVKKQKANKELSKRMNESFHCTNDNVALAIPNAFSYYPYYDRATTRFWRKYTNVTDWIKNNYNHSRQYFDAHISAVYETTSVTHCVNIDKFYETMRNIWRDKDIVILRGNNGEVYEYDVYDSARSQTVYYGLANNSWSNYLEYKNLLMNEDPNKLFIISLGHLSKILVYDLAMEGRRALDLGHLAKDYEYYMRKLPITYKFFDV